MARSGLLGQGLLGTGLLGFGTEPETPATPAVTAQPPVPKGGRLGWLPPGGYPKRHPLVVVEALRCPACKGFGWDGHIRCPHCRGSGAVKVETEATPAPAQRAHPVVRSEPVDDDDELALALLGLL